VPAYNEEVNAVRTIDSLLMQDYPNLQVIFIDDGSKEIAVFLGLAMLSKKTQR
jgi:glycosyltransferase involved in cell wall biosynthesis